MREGWDAVQDLRMTGDGEPSWQPQPASLPSPNIWLSVTAGFVGTGLISYLIAFHAHLRDSALLEAALAGLLLPAVVVACVMPRARVLNALVAFSGSLLGGSLVLVIVLMRLVSHFKWPFAFDG
jgi:hypothetical protein